MSDAVANVRYRWRMGIEARALTMLTALLLAFGLVTVYSASVITAMDAHLNSAAFLLRQLSGVLGGIVLFMVAAKVDADRWYKWAWPIMVASIILLIAVLFTHKVHGSRRYLIGTSVQPSEIAKLAVVIWTSMLIVKKGDALRRLSKGLFPFLVVLFVLDLLVWVEPDISSAMFYTLIMGIILFAGGARVGHFVVLGIVAMPVMYTRAKSLQYLVLRMSAYFDPGAAPSAVDYQQQQSLIAVGSGGLFGTGYGSGRQQYGFLPFAYDDFIAGIIGEEWGFLGMLCLILSFTLYAWLGFRIAKNARSPFLRLVAIGLTSTMVITAFLHIGVAIKLLPNTGLTLPFISYGRSNLLLSLFMTGILVNIGSEREKVIGSGATNPLALTTA